MSDEFLCYLITTFFRTLLSIFFLGDLMLYSYQLIVLRRQTKCHDLYLGRHYWSTEFKTN